MKDGIRRIQQLAWGLILAISTHLAQADLISFDSLDPSEGSVTDQNYAGFSWDSRWALGDTHLRGFSSAWPDETQFLFNSGFENNLEITRDNPFNFLGAHFASNSVRDNRSFWISLLAYDDQGEKVGELKNAQINSDYQNKRTWIGADFTNVSRLIVVSGGGLFAMDSLEFQNPAIEVNEAGGFALVFIGLCGLWAARRRLH